MLGVVVFPTFCSNILFYWPVCRFSVSNEQITSILVRRNYTVQQKIASLSRVIMLYMQTAISLYQCRQFVCTSSCPVSVLCLMYAIFWQISIIIRSYGLTQNDRIRHKWGSIFLEVSYIPVTRDGAQRPETFLRSLTDAQTVWSTETKFGKVTHVRCNVFLCGQLQRPQRFWGTTCAHTVWETTKFCMAIKLNVRKIFTRSISNIFAVANLLFLSSQ